ncbi:MAG TPA: SURF1 family protein [Afifellaceae bacterium]|nr:SURF1 family protein [Afifellaceae bacterium]
MTTDKPVVRPASLIAAVILVGAFIVLIMLGNWQMRRLAWKEDLIARVAERIGSPPLDLTGGGLSAAGNDTFLSDNEYRPVTIEGRFDDSGTVDVFTAISDPRGPLQGPGYWIFTPLIVAPQMSVFVNRGFVPFDRLDETPPPPEGTVRVTGPLRAPETGNFMTPDPDIANRVWHIRIPLRIAPAIGFAGEVLPFFIDADASFTPPGGLPQAGETRTVFTNNHLQYALTWYGLALALAGVCAVYVIKRQNSAVA